MLICHALLLLKIFTLKQYKEKERKKKRKSKGGAATLFEMWGCLEFLVSYLGEIERIFRVMGEGSQLLESIFGYLVA